MIFLVYGVGIVLVFLYAVGQAKVSGTFVVTPIDFYATYLINFPICIEVFMFIS